MKLKKKYGQNLLVDAGYIEKMLKASNVRAGDAVFEIGPGSGLLTEALLRRSISVVAVEIDADFSGSLSKLQRMYPERLEVVYGDVMEFDLEKHLGGRRLPLKVFANIPYYITSPIIELLIGGRRLFSDIYLTIQKEVAQRICAGPQNRARSSFTFFAEYYTCPELLFCIPASAFLPAPDVDSAVIHMEIRSKPPVLPPFGELEPLIRRAFQQRRKGLRNSLKGLAPGRDISELLKEAGVDPLARPETLGLEDFARIADMLKR